MKKVMITLGFAAATILAANAQDTDIQDNQTTNPAQSTQPTGAPVEPQTQPMQDQPAYEQDETLDQAETVPDQARDTQTPTYDPAQDPSSITEPTQTPDDISNAPMEPTQEETIGDPSSTPNTTTDPNVSVDEMQEEVREMQGSPADPQRDSNMDAQASTQQIGEEGGVKSITQAELPEDVTKGLKDSEFAQATIEEVYLLEDQAIDKLMETDAEQMYIGDQLPEKLYQLRVKGEEERSLLYFDETGELLGSKSM